LLRLRGEGRGGEGDDCLLQKKIYKEEGEMGEVKRGSIVRS